jgi:RNA polymerase sigma-70 factor (ECF subfamily)
MNRREKRRAKQEIAAIASLKDSEIDTSDVSEISDWSGAVRGKFYSRKAMSKLPLKDAVSEAKSLATSEHIAERGEKANEGMPGVLYGQITIEQLVAECSTGIGDAWFEFVRRFHRLITSVAIRAGSEWGQTSPDVIENLTQDVYVKLSGDGYKLLKEFRSSSPNTFTGYLKVVTANVAMDYFRAHASAKRGTAKLERGSPVISANSGVAAESNIFFDEVDAVLRTSVPERDQTVFWLHYREGFTAKQIAAIPTLNLTVKGVESILWRLKELVKRRMTES